MALSLDSSSFYYGGVHGHHAPGHGHDQGGYLQYAVIPGLGGHDVYGGHPQLMDQQSAAAMAASLFSARTGGGGYDVDGAGGGYDVNGAGASVPSQGQPHPLALSMSSGTGSQSCTITMQVGAHDNADAVNEYVATDGGSKKRGGGGGTGEKQAVVHRKSIDTFGQHTSRYRGVTRYRRTGRYDARLKRKGRQVHLGYYDNEEKAAMAYDLAALKYLGKSTHLNFSIEDYKDELVEMENMSNLEYVAHLKRKNSRRKTVKKHGATSQYHGVLRNKRWGRYVAQIWDNSSGQHVYLGLYDNEEKAARAYDLAALKYLGKSTHLNFSIEDYKDELVEMEKMSWQEYVAHLIRKSSGFSHGTSKYRGVYYRPKGRPWQAQLFVNKKFLNLGTFNTQEEAAEAYDMAAIKIRGLSAVTNFDITRYDVDKIMESNTPLPGDQVRCWKAGVAGTAASDANAVAVARAVTAAVARADDHGGSGGGGYQQQQQHEDPLSELFWQLEDIVSL